MRVSAPLLLTLSTQREEGISFSPSFIRKTGLSARGTRPPSMGDSMARHVSPACVRKEKVASESGGFFTGGYHTCARAGSGTRGFPVFAVTPRIPKQAFRIRSCSASRTGVLPGEGRAA